MSTERMAIPRWGETPSSPDFLIGTVLHPVGRSPGSQRMIGHHNLSRSPRLRRMPALRDYQGSTESRPTAGRHLTIERNDSTQASLNLGLSVKPTQSMKAMALFIGETLLTILVIDAWFSVFQLLGAPLWTAPTLFIPVAFYFNWRIPSLRIIRSRIVPVALGTTWFLWVCSYFFSGGWFLLTAVLVGLQAQKWLFVSDTGSSKAADSA
jgi:hypothetical protein